LPKGESKRQGQRAAQSATGEDDAGNEQNVDEARGCVADARCPSGAQD
jgi:hypothetical protein